MNKLETVIITATVFFTLIAWVIMEVYQIQIKSSFDQSIMPAKQPVYKIDTTIFNTLQQRTP